MPRRIPFPKIDSEKRHLDVTGQKLLRDNFCLSIVLLAIALTPRVISKEEKCPPLWVRDSLGGILGDNFGEGNCESKNSLEAVGRQFLL